MGNSINCSGFTEEMLDEYATLTYLSKNEILSLCKKFYSLGKEKMDSDFHYRFPCEIIIDWFPNLKCNPFVFRICEVFSSRNDGCFSFEDMLDLCSIMSQNCPEKVKAKWAFKIFDFDGDEKISGSDISYTIDLLTKNKNSEISAKDKEYIAKTLIDEINIQKTGGITELEFEHAVGKMSEFAETFHFSV